MDPVLQENVRFHIPVEIVKGKDKDGNTTMKMRGVASTPSLDADGEYLDPKGFESDYFLKHGFMNWNHQTNDDPTAIIGKPTTAVVKGQDYVIEYNLFPESQKAKQVYELQKVLETQGLALGLSIEGKVLERDPNNKSKVTKAKITGCAVTPNPKNQDTVTEIIKAKSYKALEDDEKDEEDDEEKALSAGSSSGQAIAKESLDGSTKKTCMTEKMTKGQVLEKISRDLPNLSANIAEQIFNLSKSIQNSIDMSQETQTPEVTAEAISKAYETLGIPNPAEVNVDAATIEKAEVTPAVETPAVETPQVATQPEAAVETPAVETAPTAESTEEKLAKALERIEALEKGGATPAVEATPATETPEVEVPTAQIEKGITPGAEGTEMVKAISTIFKGQLNTINKDNNEKFHALGLLIKGQQDQMGEMAEIIGKLSGQPDGGRKSITTQKEHIVEKSFAGEQDINKANQDGPVLSLSNNKVQIAKALTDEFMKGEGKDEQLRKSILAYEQANQASPYLLKKATELGINLVK